MNDDLLRYNDKQKYLIFDFETCNLNLVSQKTDRGNYHILLLQKTRYLKKQTTF